MANRTDDAQTVRITADRIARAALLYLRDLNDATAEDYRVVALTLQTAAEMVPDDVELRRLLLEAWYAAGDEAKVIEVTREIIRLDPSDTVAQLRLISDRISRYQSVEERQTAFDRLLGESGGAIDPSVRSRLALDDALLARELGDEQRFVERLSMATQLDSSNKPAAVLAATYALERLTDPIARIEMLANVVLADPFDSTTHFSLADELFSRGAFKNSQRFFQHAFLLRRLSGAEATHDLTMRVLLTQWAVDGAQAFIDMIAENERSQRFVLRKQREAAELAGEDPNMVPPFQPSPMNESLRLAAAVALGDLIEAQAALDRFKLMTSAIIEQIQEMTPVEGADEAAAATEKTIAIQEWKTNLLWHRLLAGLELDAAETTIEELATAAEAGLIRREAVQRFRGLLAAQRGERERAYELLEPLADEDERARAGLGMADERAGDVRSALRQYAILAQRHPGSLLGVWSLSRLEKLLGQPLAPTPLVQKIEAYCASLPGEIDRLIREPRAILHLEASQVKDALQPFDRLEVKIRVRNVSPIPLALGPGAPISSDVLLSPRLTLGSNQVIEQVKPEVVSLDRRLRLLPGESLEATVWAGQGQTGLVNDQAVLLPALLRWRVVQGFGVTAKGDFAPSPLSLTAEAQIVRRPPLAPPAGGLMQLPEHLRNDTGVEFLKAVTIAPAAIQVATQRGNEEIGLQLMNDIIAAVQERLPFLTSCERALLAHAFPTARAAQAFEPIDKALQADGDQRVRLLYMYSRAQTPDDEVFAFVSESGDPKMMQIAARLQERLRRKLETANAPSK